jgi:predicted Zn-dependent protease
MTNLIERAEELFNNGKQTEARYLLMSILEQDPNNVEAHNNLGVVLYVGDNVEGGLAHLEKAISLDAFHRDAIINYIEVLESTNQLQRAIPILKKYCEEHPDDRELTGLLERIVS